MAVMAKKNPQTEPDAELPPDTILIRLPDPSLALALEAYAKRTRRSRNLAIVVLLEEAMKQAGLWPANSTNGD